MATLDSNPKPAQRRSLRLSLATALAGVIAIAAIVAILAGTLAVNERRVADLQDNAPAAVAPAAVRAVHPSAGLLAPPPVRIATAAPLPRFPAPHADDPDPAFVPPSDAPSVVDVTATPNTPPPPAPAANDTGVEVPDLPARPPRQSLGEYLGFVQFTKLRDASLGRPDSQVNPARLQPPQTTGDLALIRAESRMAPRTMGQTVADRQAFLRLYEQRSRARLDRSRIGANQTPPQ